MTTKTTSETTAIEPVVAEVIQARPAFEVITTPEEATLVGEYLKDIRAVRKRIGGHCDPEISKAHGLWKSLRAKKNDLDGDPAHIEATFRQMLVDWHERERLRVAAEQKKLDDAARANALREARKAGDKATHQAVLKREIPVVSTQAPAPVQKVAGVSGREYWKAEVTDLMLLAKGVVRGIYPLSYIEPGMKALNGAMRSTEGQMKINGVRAVKKTGVAVR